MEKNSYNVPPLCPSAPSSASDGVVFGVVVGTAENPQVAYLDKPQPITDELIALSEPAKPTEVFRFAASCAERGCQHFDGSNCRLAQKIVNMLPTATETLPPCHLRPNCRWWQQEGKAACMRCPQIVTETYYPSEQLRQAANPDFFG